MSDRRLIDSRDKAKPELVYPAPHPDCHRPHYKSPAQFDLLNRTVTVAMERDALRAQLRHLELECDDLHCPWCWWVQQAAALQYQAEARVLGRWHALAERALKSRSEKDRLDWIRATKQPLEDAVAEELAEIREQTMKRTDYWESP